MNINNYFYYLPTEVKCHIFSFLDASTLNRCSTVCKEWSDLASNDFLWKTILVSKADKFASQLLEKVSFQAESIKTFLKNRTINSLDEVVNPFNTFLQTLKKRDRGVFRCISLSDCKLMIYCGIGITERTQKNVYQKEEYYLFSEKFSCVPLDDAGIKKYLINDNSKQIPKKLRFPSYISVFSIIPRNMRGVLASLREKIFSMFDEKYQIEQSNHIDSLFSKKTHREPSAKRRKLNTDQSQ